MSFTDSDGMKEIFPWLYSQAIVQPCGSRVTCDPAPENTDADYLVYVLSPKIVKNVESDLIGKGFVVEGNPDYYDGPFISMRKGHINLIITDDYDFFLLHMKATAVCKHLNILDKPTRIRIFEIILYDTIELQPHGKL